MAGERHAMCVSAFMCTNTSTQSGLQIAPKCVVVDDDDDSDDRHKVLSNISQSDNDSLSQPVSIPIHGYRSDVWRDCLLRTRIQHNTTQRLVLSFNKSINNKTSHLYPRHYAAVVWTSKLCTSIRGECSEMALIGQRRRHTVSRHTLQGWRLIDRPLSCAFHSTKLTSIIYKDPVRTAQ